MAKTKKIKTKRIKYMFSIRRGGEAYLSRWWFGRETLYKPIPIPMEEIEALCRKRQDVALKYEKTAKDNTILLIDPTGRIGETLWFHDSMPLINNPKVETLEWMISLAKDLDARVTDNMVRTYRTSNDYYVHPDDQERYLHHKKKVKEAHQYIKKISKNTANEKGWRRWLC